MSVISRGLFSTSHPESDASTIAHLSRNTPRLFWAWLAIAITLSAANLLLWQNAPMTSPGAVVSAREMVMARSFAEQGLFPVQNPALPDDSETGLATQAPVSWSVLPTVALGAGFRVLGESPLVRNGFLLLLLFANAAALFLLGETLYGRRIGIGAATAWLLMPVGVRFGSNLLAGYRLAGYSALLFGVLTLLAFVKAKQPGKYAPYWAWAGAGFVAGGVWTDWKIILLPAILLAFSQRQKERSGLLLARRYLFTGLFASLSLLLLFASRMPGTVTETMQSLLLRSGLGGTASLMSGRLTFDRLQASGLLDALALLAMPALAMVVGICIGRWWTTLEKRERTLQQIRRQYLAGSLLPLLLVVPLLQSLWAGVQVSSRPHGDSSMATANKSYFSPQGYGQDIRKATETDAVVLVPSNPFIPAYYSNRHLIGNAANKHTIARIIAHLAETSPNTPTYVAIPPAMEARFPRLGRLYREIRRTPHLILFAVSGSISRFSNSSTRSAMLDYSLIPVSRPQAEAYGMHSEF